jgi:hypothetical protein
VGVFIVSLENLTAYAPYIVSVVGLVGVWYTLKLKDEHFIKQVKLVQQEAVTNAHKLVYDQEIIDRAKFRHDLMERVDALQLQLEECLKRCQACEGEHLDTKLLFADERTKRLILENEIAQLRDSKNK